MLKINYIDGGFFACCTILLEAIVNYFNENKQLPDYIDTINVYNWYKTEAQLNDNVDIRSQYFEENSNIIIDYTPLNNSILTADELSTKLPNSNLHRYNKNVDYEGSYQFLDYSKLDLGSILPFIQRYFSPSQQTKNIISQIENKYNIDYDNICVLFFRGNDKFTETQLPNYSEIYEDALKIYTENPDIKFLIQSDETEFIEFMTNTFPNNSFYFKDEMRHMKRCNNTVDRIMKTQNSEYSKYFLAIVMIMAKCKYIVCSSGNCSIWTIFFRGNVENVYQHLKPPIIYNPSNSKLFIPR